MESENGNKSRASEKRGAGGVDGRCNNQPARTCNTNAGGWSESTVFCPCVNAHVKRAHDAYISTHHALKHDVQTNKKVDGWAQAASQEPQFSDACFCLMRNEKKAT